MRFIKKNGRVIPIRDGSEGIFRKAGSGLAHVGAQGLAGASGYLAGSSLHSTSARQAIYKVAGSMATEYAAKKSERVGNKLIQSSSENQQRRKKGMLINYLGGVGIGAFSHTFVGREMRPVIPPGLKNIAKDPGKAFRFYRAAVRRGSFKVVK